MWRLIPRDTYVTRSYFNLLHLCPKLPAIGTHYFSRCQNPCATIGCCWWDPGRGNRFTKRDSPHQMGEKIFLSAPILRTLLTRKSHGKSHQNRPANPPINPWHVTFEKTNKIENILYLNGSLSKFHFPSTNKKDLGYSKSIRTSRNFPWKNTLHPEPPTNACLVVGLVAYCLLVFKRCFCLSLSCAG